MTARSRSVCAPTTPMRSPGLRLRRSRGSRARSTPTPARPTAPPPPWSAPPPRAVLPPAATATSSPAPTTSATPRRHDRGQGRHVRAGSPGLVLCRLQRRRLHHRHDRFLPPRRQRLLRRHRLVHRRAVRDPRLRLPGAGRLHGLRRRRHPHLHPRDAHGAQRRQARHRPQPGPAQLDGDQLHPHLRLGGSRPAVRSP